MKLPRLGSPQISVIRERDGDTVIETEITIASQWDYLPTGVQWGFLIVSVLLLSVAIGAIIWKEIYG